MTYFIHSAILYISGFNDFIYSMKEKFNGIKKAAATSPIYEIALYSVGAVIFFIVAIVVVLLLVMLLRRD